MNDELNNMKEGTKNEWEKAKEKTGEMAQGVKNEFNKGEQEVKSDYNEFKRDL